MGLHLTQWQWLYAHISTLHNKLQPEIKLQLNFGSGTSLLW